jgi:RND superfamily putative drug exporter
VYLEIQVPTWKNWYAAAALDRRGAVLTRLARLTYFHPRSVLAGVAVFVAVAVVLGGGVADRLKPAGFTDPAAESSLAADQSSRALGYDPVPGIVVVARARRGGVGDPAARSEIRRLARTLAADPDIAAVRTPFDRRRDPRLVSRDERAALILGHFRETDEGELEDAAGRIPPKLSSRRLDVSVGGFAVGFNEVNETVREDLLRAELIAFPILAILLLVVFRGVVAAALPLAIGGIAVVGTYLALRVLSEFTETSIFALNITTALGLGLAVDYGLLLVSRYREELARSGPGWDAHRRTMETAGRAIFFSGLTVAAAAAAMVVLPQRFLYSMGAGATTVALLAAAAALFATPALLALLGTRVNSLSVRRSPVAREGSGRWYRLAQLVMRRPVPIALGVTVLLLLVAAPLTRATLIQPGNEAVPRGNDSRAVNDAVGSDFTPNLDAPITALVPRREAGGLRERIAGVRGVSAVSEPQPLTRELALIQATPSHDPLTPAAQDTARTIRSVVTPGRVGGTTAEFVDFKDSLLDHAPVVAVLIVSTTMLLLFLLTGSVILPVKTLLMNALSIAAAFGLLVVVFQEGFGAGLFAYDGPSAVETSLLVVIGATTFGLATDYAVLVLARIKEYHDQGLGNEASVALGIERTGRVITAAALLLAVVFLAFATSEIFFMKQVGFGQAVAVAIDASIVRALLVPALMRLLGDWNWWAPRPLRWFHRRLRLSESV